MPPPSKIAKLPPAIRQWLHRTFVERAFGDIVGITDELNALMMEAGVAVSVGKSAVGAESQKVKRAQEAIRATTEAARLIAETSPDAGDERSAGAMAIVQSEVFSLLLEMREAAEEEDHDTRLGRMSEAALLLSRMSRAKVNQSRWDTEVKLRAKDAAAAVTKIAKTGGLSAAQVSEIRSQILGITKRAPPPGAA